MSTAPAAKTIISAASATHDPVQLAVNYLLPKFMQLDQQELISVMTPLKKGKDYAKHRIEAYRDALKLLTEKMTHENKGCTERRSLEQTLDTLNSPFFTLFNEQAPLTDAHRNRALDIIVSQQEIGLHPEAAAIQTR